MMGLPKAALIAASALFVASVAAALVGTGVFFYHDTGFWSVFEPAPVLRAAAAVFSGLSLSSGLLLLHCKAQESYQTFAEILFGVVLFISLANLLWVAPVLFFS